jgi:hypothetical protein
MTGTQRMDKSLITLADLFLEPGHQLSQAALQQVEQANDTHVARERLADRKELGDWSSAWSLLQSHLPQLFDVPLLDILLASWQTCQQVSQYAVPDNTEPGTRTTLDLEQRSLSSTHSPRMELRIDDQLVATLPFTINLTLQFKTLRLTVGDGRIWRIESGDCEGHGSFELGGHTVVEHTFGKVQLPGRIDFPDGMPIPNPDHPYHWGDGARALAGRSG